MIRFEERMEEHRQQSGKKDESGGFAKLGDPEKALLQQAGVQETDDSKKYIWKDVKCQIAAIFDSATKSLVDSVSADNDGLYGLVLDATSFYAESGGQCGDIGYVEVDSENAFKVDDVQEFAGYVIHIGTVTNGTICSGTAATAKVDYENRKNVAPNHTMTHILNLALRNVLGGECNQKGSLNDAEKLRFDYSTNRSLSMKDIAAVSEECRDVIKQDLKVVTKVLEYQEATKINALRAMFGERYPKMVRVVAIGIDPEAALKTPDDAKNMDYSIELCGGTHVTSTGEADSFVFLSDDALSAGIRRVVCLTGFAAKRAIQDALELREEFKEAASLSGPELSAKCPLLSSKLDNAKICAVEKDELRKVLSGLNETDKTFKKQLGKQRKKKVVEMVSNIDTDALCGDFVVKRIDVGLDKKALKEGIKKFYKNKSNANTPIMLISCSPNEKNKIIIVAEVPKAAVQRGIHCGQWVQSTLPFIDGPQQWKGGKSEKKAEVQGTTMSNVAKVIETASKWVNDQSNS